MTMPLCTEQVRVVCTKPYHKPLNIFRMNRNVDSLIHLWQNDHCYSSKGGDQLHINAMVLEWYVKQAHKGVLVKGPYTLGHIVHFWTPFFPHALKLGVSHMLFPHFSLHTLDSTCFCHCEIRMAIVIFQHIALVHVYECYMLLNNCTSLSKQLRTYLFIIIWSLFKIYQKESVFLT